MLFQLNRLLPSALPSEQDNTSRRRRSYETNIRKKGLLPHCDTNLKTYFTAPQLHNIPQEKKIQLREDEMAEEEEENEKDFLNFECSSDQSSKSEFHRLDSQMNILHEEVSSLRTDVKSIMKMLNVLCSKSGPLCSKQCISENVSDESPPSHSLTTFRKCSSSEELSEQPPPLSTDF